MKNVLIVVTLVLSGCAANPSLETYRETVTWLATPTLEYTRTTIVSVRAVTPIVGVQVQDVAPVEDTEL